MRDAQKADIRNSVMPKDVTTGQVIWWELTPGSLIGRAEVSNVKQGIAGSFSCGTGSCPVGFNSASVSPGSMTAVVGGAGSFLAQETDRDCFGSLFGPYNVNATWSSSNTSVVTVNSSGSASCVGPGTAGLTATWLGKVYNCDPNSNCSTTTVNASPAAAVTVNPKISGANSIWWFGGLSPTGYITATTLTASPPNASSYQWAITAGNVVFSNGSKSMNTTANQVLVRSSGMSPPNQPNDVAIQVTVQVGTKSYQSPPFKMTVLAPHSLFLIGTPTDRADATFTYASLITYKVLDQYGTQMPTSVAMSEFFTTNLVKDYSGTNWEASPPSGGPTDANAEFKDLVSGPTGLGSTPEATPPQAPLSSVKVVHLSGQFQVGSNTPGQGLVVQTQTWQHYIDHGRHENVVSPVPGQ